MRGAPARFVEVAEDQHAHRLQRLGAVGYALFKRLPGARTDPAHSAPGPRRIERGEIRPHPGEITHQWPETGRKARERNQSKARVRLRINRDGAAVVQRRDLIRQRRKLDGEPVQSGHYRFGLQFHRFRRARSEFKLLCLNYLPFFQKFQLQLLRRIVTGQRDRHREFHRRIRPHRLRHPEFAKRSVARLPQLRTEFHRKHRSRSASRPPAGNIAAVAQHHRRRQSARAVKFIQFRKRTAPVGGKLRLRRFARRQPVVEGVARDRSGVSETAQEAVRKRIRRVEPGFAVRIGDLHRS